MDAASTTRLFLAISPPLKRDSEILRQTKSDLKQRQADKLVELRQPRHTGRGPSAMYATVRAVWNEIYTGSIMSDTVSVFETRTLLPETADDSLRIRSSWEPTHFVP
jgi:hypothetical protein